MKIKIVIFLIILCFYTIYYICSYKDDILFVINYADNIRVSANVTEIKVIKKRKSLGYKYEATVKYGKAIYKIDVLEKEYEAFIQNRENIKVDVMYNKKLELIKDINYDVNDLLINFIVQLLLIIVLLNIFKT